MTPSTKASIKKLIKDKILEKLEGYKSETSYTPFFSAIFDEETIVQGSIMQSLYTSFGMSIYEQIAVILAKDAGYYAERQHKLVGEIDPATEALIHQIAIRPTPNKLVEIEEIRNLITISNGGNDHENTVDVFIRKPDGSEIYIDITTVKPNLKEFRTMRRKLLRWSAIRLSQNKNTTISTYIGIPYNPYYPEAYQRWTGKLCDPVYDILVQNDLWQAFAGYDVFDELIEIFKEVGIETQKEVRTFLVSKKKPPTLL
jgi:hypothetical protein